VCFYGAYSVESSSLLTPRTATTTTSSTTKILLGLLHVLCLLPFWCYHPYYRNVVPTDGVFLRICSIDIEPSEEGDEEVDGQPE